MTKKEFTDKDLIDLNSKSDIELIELLNTTPHTGLREMINVLLNFRLKIVLNHLKEVTERSATTSSHYNKILIWLTIILTVLTGVMVLQALFPKHG